MSKDPHALFDAWLRDAEASEPNDPNACAVATVGADGQPSNRIVLMKDHDARGFVFYTNLDSRKGGELAAHPKAAMTFHWKSLRRSVRIEGAVETVSDAEADAYFASRSRASQVGARASDQSRPLPSRQVFEDRCAAVEAEYEGQDVPRPARWSGYRVIPQRIEFWADRPHRLHERRLFTLQDDGWSEGLLFP